MQINQHALLHCFGCMVFPIIERLVSSIKDLDGFGVNGDLHYHIVLMSVHHSNYPFDAAWKCLVVINSDMHFWVRHMGKLWHTLPRLYQSCFDQGMIVVAHQ